VRLARARELAKDARARLAEGINPKDARKPIVGATFGECADRLMAAMRPSWRSIRHAEQWEATLRKYAAPLRRLPVHTITTDDVLSVLKPLWIETSSWDDAKVILPNHVLEVASMRKQFVLVRVDKPIAYLDIDDTGLVEAGYGPVTP
jgi:hypothetical protein